MLAAVHCRGRTACWFWRRNIFREGWRRRQRRRRDERRISRAARFSYVTIWECKYRLTHIGLPGFGRYQTDNEE
ncbi:MAG: hypothetical protein CTY15_08350 [Methylocystis sp.]|nr:MAG: hypothetical protein CTY15_08350 [Methylocystis sp.]